MLTARFVAGVFSVALLVLGLRVVSGQDYPNKPIRIVTTGAGGNTDFTARLIAQGISGPLSQQVIVDNRASQVIAAEIVAKAPPDGYTLLLSGGGVWVGPLLRETPYDLARDFLPITLALRAPNILVVHPSLPVKSVKELIALAKSRPGAINCASGTIGGSGHLTAELFKAMAGINIVNIPYRSSGPTLNALIGGEAQMLFESPAAVEPHIKSGRLRALAVTSAEPSALFPGLPTVAASGLRGFESTQLAGVFAPAKTPALIMKQLNQEIVRVLNTTDAKEKFLKVGVEAVSTSPEEFAAIIKSDIAVWSKLIKNLAIRAE